MCSSRLSTYGSLAGAVLFILFLLPSSIVYARTRPVGFQIPSRMIPLGQAITPGEYALLQKAIKANWERDKARVLRSGPPLGSHFTHIVATRIRLGSLGQALVVNFGNSPECGATGNCPTAVYVHEPNGYRRVIKAGGWGNALLPSGGPVPDVVFYWNMSAEESDAQLFHYTNDKFVPTRTAVCNGKNTSAICTAMNRHPQNLGGGVSLNEYDALRPAVEANLEKESPALARRYSFDDAHAVGILWIKLGTNLVTASAVGMGPCGYNRNCNISIYARHNRNPEGRYFPLLRNVTGWGVTGGTFNGSAPAYTSFVIARRLSPNEDELTRYTTPLAVSGRTPGLTSDSRLLPDACEIVTPKSGHWPAQWDAAALVARPVSCFKTGSPANTQIPAADMTNVSRVVKDSTGTVWAIGNGLNRWRNGGWSGVPTPVQVASLSLEAGRRMQENELIPRPIGLWKGPDTGVLVLWQLKESSPKSALVWQRGDQTKVLADLPPAGQPDFFRHGEMNTVVSAVSGTNFIVGNEEAAYRDGVPLHLATQYIYRLDPKGQMQQIYSVAPDQYLPYPVPRFGLRSMSLLHFHATRDAQGKVWLWCSWLWPGGPRGPALEGFLVTNGKTVEYHRQIPGIPGSHLTSVSLWDSHHLAVGTFGGGLYTINTTTLEARAIPEPEPGAFRFVQKVFSAGKDHYVLTIGREYGRGIPLFERPYLTGDLWRLHDGRWKEVLSDIGNTFGVGLATPQGFWLGAPDSRGLWFVPLRGRVQKVDWRQGLPLAAIGRLFRLPGGDILATDAGNHPNTRTVEFRPASVLAPQPGSSRFSVVHPLTQIEPDRHHNLWGLLPNRVLGEWNGSQWVRHPLPPRIDPSRIVSLDVDTRGRVWLFPNCRMGPMGFFNPADQLWTVYRDYRFALARRAHPVKFLHPSDDPERPIYGPGPQIVLVGPCWGVNYFDGTHWRVFQRRLLPQNRDVAIPPFFDSGGHLALEINHSTWQWTPSTRWQQTAEVPPQNYVPMLPNPFAPPPPPPSGCKTPPPSTLVKDSLGQSWWVAGDALYEGVPDHCRKVLSASARQPFIDGRKLVAAQIGPYGDAFLKTNMPFVYIVVPRKLFGGEVPPRARRSKGH